MIKDLALVTVGFFAGIYGIMRYWHKDRDGCMNSLDRNTSNW